MGDFSGKKLLSVTDFNDYMKWKEECMNEDKCPCAAIFLFADSELLFWRETGALEILSGAGDNQNEATAAERKPKRDFVTMPWLQRLRCELVARPTGADGREKPIKASYVGFGTDDAPEYFQLFVEAMKGIGIYDCLQITAGDIKTEPTKPMLAHLERSDVVVIGGGDPWKLWTKMEMTGVHEQIRWRYYEGACIVGIGTGAMVLGEKGFRWDSPFRGTPNEHLIDETTDERHPHIFGTMKIVPFVVAPDSAEVEEFVEYIKTGTVALTISKGGGVIFNTDGLFEPVRHAAFEVRHDWRSEDVKRCFLLPPPRLTGTVMAFERAGGLDKVYGQITEEEQRLRIEEERREMELEAVEERNLKGFEPSIEARSRSAQLRTDGNARFKAGDWLSALERYIAAGTEDEQEPSVELNKAAALLKLQRFAEAVLAADRALVLFTADRCDSEKKLQAKAWFRRGLAFEGLNDVENAVWDVKTALAVDPEFKPAKSQLAKWKQLNTVQEKREEFYYANHEVADVGFAALKAEAQRTKRFVVDSEKKLPAGALWVWEELPLDKQLRQSMQHLVISVPLGVEGCRFLCEGLRTNSTLQVLELHRCFLRPAGTVFVANMLAANDSILELSLNDCCVRDEGLATLVSRGLVDNSRLERLELQGNGLTGRSGVASNGGKSAFQELCNWLKAPDCALRSLSLGRNRLGFAAARELAATLKAEWEGENLKDRRVYGGLERLDLGSNWLFSDAVYRLASGAIGHPSLLSIDLSGRRLSKVTTRELRERCKYERCQFIFFDQPAREDDPLPSQDQDETTDDKLLTEVDWVVQIDLGGLDDIDDIRMLKQDEVERPAKLCESDMVAKLDDPVNESIRMHSFY